MVFQKLLQNHSTRGLFNQLSETGSFRMEGFMEEVGLLRNRHIKKSGVGRTQEEEPAWEG